MCGNYTKMPIQSRRDESFVAKSPTHISSSVGAKLLSKLMHDKTYKLSKIL